MAKSSAFIVWLGAAGLSGCKAASRKKQLLNDDAPINIHCLVAVTTYVVLDGQIFKLYIAHGPIIFGFALAGRTSLVGVNSPGISHSA
jgi:hypothetical protein